ncbi:L,D-transpeptidase family protein [Nitratireductor sp. GCM10026969]|uniref:L,D-transpeptidase family protein n=1 Tax=Nitratireductor sp. GCM10026969 TaxID=3252645 RepID=UPI00361472B5
MLGKRAKGAGLSALALTIAITGSVPEAAAAQNLFDMLFGERQQRSQSERGQAAPRPRQPEARARQPAPLPKISGPSYYNYKPEGLVKVDFPSLSSALRQQVNEESLFAEALGFADINLLAEKEVSAALLNYYAENPDFIWIENGRPNARAKKVLRVLEDAGEYGLLEADYAVSTPFAAPKPSVDAADERKTALLRFEMTLSARALRYARDAHWGRINPNKLSGYHDFPQKTLDEGRVLRALAHSPKPAAYLTSLHPKNEYYATLRAELKALRESAEKEIVVDPETFVRPGASHPEFPKILRIIERDADAEFRAEHGPVLLAHAGSETYVPELEPVIKAAQRTHDLNPDGIVGRQTVGALAGESKQARIRKVVLALERLRWHPSYFGNTRVMINAASYTASFVEEGEERLSMRAVVGKPSNQTNFFHDEIEYVEFNPYWGVPRSILINEKLPKLRRDPGYLDRTGYEVINSAGRRVPSASIDWSRYGANIPFSVRQRPGPQNALGELKIMFPNTHNIYMHDTPAKHLFGRDTRAYSHGCVRLQDPRAMAAAVLETTTDDVAREIGTGRNGRRNLPKKIPVYVGYFTAWPERSGAVGYYPDIYERDEKLSTALAKVEELRAPGS